MKQRTEQIIVNPNSSTFEELADGVKHWGMCLCPFCNKPNVVAGPSRGSGLAWVYMGCRHNIGTAATEKDYEISVLFKGITQ